MTPDASGCGMGAGPGDRCTVSDTRSGEFPCDTRDRTGDHGQPHAHGHGAAGGHPHDHAHDHARALGVRGLTLVLAITAAFMVAEFVGGWLSNSLALVADAAHMLTDAASLALALFAVWFARRPATAAKTYGYARSEILAALVNGAGLLVIAAFIVYEAWSRLRHPEPIQTGIMAGVAAAGMLANIASAVILHRSAGESLNVRGAYLHVLSDLLGSAGAVVAALVIMATGWVAADPILSLAVAVLIVFSSWKLLRESVDVLLEAVPAHIDLAEVRRAIDDVPGVDDVHDLHVWTVTSGFLAMSGHCVVAEPKGSQQILREIHHRMRERFGIHHATIQLEWPGGSGPDERLTA